MEIAELAPGLRRWTALHPEWQEDVACHYVETDTATLLIDPLIPRGEKEAFLQQVDGLVEHRRLRVRILLTASHHRRSADELAARYEAEIWDGEGPLPAGVRTFRVEHPKPVERPLWLESQRTLVFGDTLTTRSGELRVWWDLRWPEGESWYHDRLVPSLRPLAELPVERVLVGHGPPAPGAELAAALERPPYS